MLRYTLRHKWYVFTYCLVWMIPIRGFFHDWSKFIPWVYKAYRRWFYGEWLSTDEALLLSRAGHPLPEWIEPNVKNVYDQAWNLHQKLEAHHWQRWILIEDDRPMPRALEMPYKVVKHMVANWLGAGRMRTSRDEVVAECRGWYLERRYKLILHSRTRATVEHLLDLYTDIVAGDDVARTHWERLRNYRE